MGGGGGGGSGKVWSWSQIPCLFVIDPFMLGSKAALDPDNNICLTFLEPNKNMCYTYLEPKKTAYFEPKNKSLAFFKSYTQF